jgi:hypothetical protein
MALVMVLPLAVVAAVGVGCCLAASAQEEERMLGRHMRGIRRLPSSLLFQKMIGFGRPVAVGRGYIGPTFYELSSWECAEEESTRHSSHIHDGCCLTSN